MSDETLIVGPGRLGATLAIALAARGWPLAAVAGRRPESGRALARRLPSKVRCATLDQLGGPFPVILITVADDAIGEVASEIARLELVDEASVVMHASGVHASDVLGPVAARGASVGSLHPLQTFPDVDSALRALPGTHWFIEGAPPAVETARRVVATLEGICHLIATGEKTLYHASASMACNLMTALLDAALDASSAAGLERREMLNALAPLVRAALDNAIATDPAASLTGPISRGDAKTVAMHLRAIDGIDDLPIIYRALAGRSVAIARAQGQIDASKASTLLRCIDDRR